MAFTAICHNIRHKDSAVESCDRSPRKEDRVAIDVFNENLVTYSEAAKLLPRRPHGGRVGISTIHRWRMVGLRSTDGMRVKLETVKVGGICMTSKEALQRFFDRLSGDESIVRPSSPTQRQRDRDRERRIRQAEEELRRAGI
jgi:hypothetical protein